MKTATTPLDMLLAITESKAHYNLSKFINKIINDSDIEDKKKMKMIKKICLDCSDKYFDT